MRLLSSLLSILAISLCQAQAPHQPSSAEIYADMQKLNVLGSVLYLAAHPDDENTRFMAYCAKEKHFQTAYMSLTRGDGGQNLIGPELRESLGLIRTQELLAARRVDGGQQFFSRANDFGYSKTAEETLEIWDKELVLGDLVKVIRQQRPDIIVCRFPTNGDGGHGHHTASALLGLEAFDLAADPAAYPEQLEDLEPWQALRIVVNTGRWWNDSISIHDPGVVGLDIGAYSATLGISCNEIAAQSRSMHKSQGFGTGGSRGEHLEYFEHLAGEIAEEALFEGYAADWSRIAESSKVSLKIKMLLDRYDIAHPEASISSLIELHKEVSALDDDYWRPRKLAEIEALIVDCAGLYLEANSSQYWASPGDSLSISFELNARNTTRVQWSSVEIAKQDLSVDGLGDLDKNVTYTHDEAIRLAENLNYSQAYWLQAAGSIGTYTIPDDQMIGEAENPAALEALFRLSIDGLALKVRRPVTYKWSEPVAGERYRPFVITPAAFVNFEQPSYLFTPGEEQELRLSVKAVSDGFQGDLIIAEVPGWEISPLRQAVQIDAQGLERTYSIRISPAVGAEPLDLKASLVSGGQRYDMALQQMDYAHIPAQVYMPQAETRLVYVDLEKNNLRIAYITGAGDAVPQCLRSIGYTVDELTEADISLETLKSYDAVLTGIRLLNVDERVKFYMPELLAYAEQGGTLVMQYNTRHALKIDDFSPYPLTLSRDRVTEEDAEVRFLSPEHEVLQRPNLITNADFDHWVQERGLYFPSEWDERYASILSWNDRGEEAKDGALLIADYGEGHFVYTSISFFRELPAGVPGAYRLLSNILSLGN